MKSEDRKIASREYFEEINQIPWVRTAVVIVFLAAVLFILSALWG